MEQTSANPHHRVFLTPRVRNYEMYMLHASHLGKNVWENHVLEMGEKKKTHGETGDIFGQEGEHK